MVSIKGCNPTVGSSWTLLKRALGWVFGTLTPNHLAHEGVMLMVFIEGTASRFCLSNLPRILKSIVTAIAKDTLSWMENA